MIKLVQTNWNDVNNREKETMVSTKHEWETTPLGDRVAARKESTSHKHSQTLFQAKNKQIPAKQSDRTSGREIKRERWTDMSVYKAKQTTSAAIITFRKQNKSYIFYIFVS